jgi:hypothetical protein
MTSDKEFCITVTLSIIYMWILFGWLITNDTKFSQTEKFIMWDIFTDDPFIAWYLSK